MAQHANEHGHAHNPAKDARTYTMVLGALLVFTFITVGASYIHFGSGIINVIIAILIATIKASLVALFFMHLRHDKPMNSIIFLVSAGFLALFLIGTYGDYVERDPLLPSNYKGVTAPPGGSGGSGPGAPTPQ